MTSISRISAAFILVSAVILSSIAGFAQTTKTFPSTDKTASTTQSPNQTATTTAKNDTRDVNSMLKMKITRAARLRLRSLGAAISR